MKRMSWEKGTGTFSASFESLIVPVPLFSLGTSSYYLNLELPMLEQAGVTGIPMY
jgi:hypothetical protein